MASEFFGSLIKGIKGPGTLLSGYVKIAIENDHLYIFVVDVPINHGGFP